MKLREGNVFSRVCQWLHGEGPRDCEPVQTCSFGNPPPCPGLAPLNLGKRVVGLRLKDLLVYTVITARNEVGARLCFYTCLWFCSEGGDLPQCMVRYNPPGADTPSPGSRPHGSRHPGAHTPPGAVHTGRYGQQVGGAHPTGMHSCYNFNVFYLVIVRLDPYWLNLW